MTTVKKVTSVAPVATGTKSWGPAVWSLFHTLAEKIHEDQYARVAPILFGFIRRICSLLPCPDCQQHAKTYLSSVSYNLTTKRGMQEFLFIFHNDVTRRKRGVVADDGILDSYKSNNLGTVYNAFVYAFHAKGIPQMFGDSMHRKRLLVDLKTWLVQNAHAFM